MAIETVNIPTYGLNGAPTAPKKQMGKDDFLLLLTKQLQYQDPLKPMENTEFVSQMASFSTLEQMTNMNKSLEKFIANADQNYKIQAMNLLGLTVTAQKADSPDPIVGVVSALKFVDGEAIFKVGDKDVKLPEIIQVGLRQFS